MTDTRRRSALIAAVMMVLVLLTSSAYLVMEADHACIGHECDVCAHMAEVQMLVRVLGLVCLLLLALRAFLSIQSKAFRTGEVCPVHAQTPVCWKVRMNN